MKRLGKEPNFHKLLLFRTKCGEFVTATF